MAGKVVQPAILRLPIERLEDEIHYVELKAAVYKRAIEIRKHLGELVWTLWLEWLKNAEVPSLSWRLAALKSSFAGIEHLEDVRIEDLDVALSVWADWVFTNEAKEKLSMPVWHAFRSFFAEHEKDDKEQVDGDALARQHCENGGACEAADGSSKRKRLEETKNAVAGSEGKRP